MHTPPGVSAAVPARRPVVGVAAYCERARWDIWDTRAVLIQQSYVAGLTGAGAAVVVLPPDGRDATVVDRIDGLVLPSGADIDPATYGQPVHPRTDRPRPDRDAGEALLLDRALERDLPVLGVCRGMQLLALAYGGTLEQHLPDLLGHERHCPHEGSPAQHDVTCEPDSLAAEIFGNRASTVTHHHQGVVSAGRLRVTARTDDGLAEAVEDPSRHFVLGVQWHPEIAGGQALFAAFVAACSVLDGVAGQVSR